MIMASISAPERVNEYLVKNNLLDVFIFLTVSADNLNNRGNLLYKSLTALNQGLQQLLQKISENPNISPYNKEVSRMVKELHYLELETIQRVCIFIELLAVYYQLTRKNIRFATSNKRTRY
jgi:hypothetical protein